MPVKRCLIKYRDSISVFLFIANDFYYDCLTIVISIRGFSLSIPLNTLFIPIKCLLLSHSNAPCFTRASSVNLRAILVKLSRSCAVLLRYANANTAYFPFICSQSSFSLIMVVYSSFTLLSVLK
jgi:hypothetical protein